MIIEGRNAVAEALRARMPLRRVMIAAGTEPGGGPIHEIEKLAAAANVRIQRVQKRDLDRASERGAHQGVMAEAAPYEYVPLDDIIKAGNGQDASLVVILDHVTDLGNLGAIARPVEVVGALGMVVPKKRSASVTPAAWKAAAGALAHVKVAQEANISQTIKRLQDVGYWVAGADGSAKQTVWQAPLEGKIALVMGSEGSGMARLTRESCDFLVRLPQAGKVGSLNVAQATTAIAYEWLRRVQASQTP